VSDEQKEIVASGDVLRDAQGRLLPGSAPLNPTGNVDVRKRHERYVELMDKAVTDEDITEIVQRAVTDAKDGNRWARKFIFDYLVGKPTVMPGGPPREAPMIRLLRAWMITEMADGQVAKSELAAALLGDGKGQ